MSRRSRWILALLAAVLLAAFVGRAAMSRKAAGAAAASAAASAPMPAVELTPGDIATVQRAELLAGLAVSGGLKAVDSAMIKARVAAEVRELNVREGDRVSAGQLLGRLDDTEFRLRLRQAEDQAAAAQAQLDIAQRTFDNNKALVDQGFISKNALDTSASSASGARASLQAALAAAELARKAVRDSEIRAPITGLVAQRLVQPGERVALDARLLEIVDLSRIELEAAVAPEDVLALRVGQRASVSVDGMAEPLPARVARINPATQAGTRAVMAYLQLQPTAGTAGLRQGLFARASIEIERKTALLVPASALRLDQARPYLMVYEPRGAAGLAVQRPVATGARGDVALAGRSEAAVEIVSGVAEGETVLRGTVGALRAGTPLKLAAPQ
jgi:membrane fusion protein (multidrug efflux system)